MPALLTTLTKRFGVRPRAALSRAMRFPANEWRQLGRALPVVLFVRLALWSTTFRRVHALILTQRSGSGRSTPGPVEELSRAVSRASRLIPNATCLTRALALQYLLRQQGEPSRIEIGFLLRDGVEVKGHAWLVCGELVVIGGESSAHFTRTLTLEG